ncbi:MAG: hypothetical protein V4632_11590 [Pseudomonadota bacterium]
MENHYTGNASPPKADAAIDQPADAEDAVVDSKSLLNEHKGKLAIGVAATLGIMVFYKWREKLLAKEDPEDYARLQRLKAGVRSGDTRSRQDSVDNNDLPE